MFKVEIIEKFTGKLNSCTLLSAGRLPNFPMGEYALFNISTSDGAITGEVCLFKNHARLIDPMSRSSEVSPVYGAEEISGKIIDSCFT